MPTIDTLSDVDLTDTDQGLAYLGDAGPGYYFQTFTIVGGSLQTIAFAIDPIQLSGTTDFTVGIVSIDADGTFGTLLFESDLITVSGDDDGVWFEASDFEILSVATGGLNLTAGQYAVVFNANAGGIDGGNAVQFLIANTSDAAERLGWYHFISSGSVEEDLGQRAIWDSSFGDIALRLEFGSLDTAPPTAPTLDLDAAADSGVFDSDNLTNDSTPTLTGTAEAGSTVTVSEGSIQLGTATADGNGSWSLTLTTGLADGAHTLTATAADAAGNVSDASAGLTVTIDTVTPDPTIASTSANSDTTPLLAGTAEAGASVEITDGDGNLVATVAADGDGNWSHQLGTLMDGDYDYQAVATDAAGNLSTAISTTVSVVVIGDTVLGGKGDDVIDGTDGRDNLSGGHGNDTLDGGWGPDVLHGDNGADRLSGGAGDDSLYGGNGADVLDGGDGDDLMVGGRGDDMMIGGDGADLFVVGGSDGNDTIADFEAGEDSLQLQDGLTVTSLATSGDDTLVYLSNGSQLTLADVNIVSVDSLFGA